MGDLTGTLLSFILGGACDLRFVHRVRDGGAAGEQAFEFDTAEIRAELGDVPLTHPDVRTWLRQFIIEGESALTRPVA